MRLFAREAPTPTPRFRVEAVWKPETGWKYDFYDREVHHTGGTESTEVGVWMRFEEFKFLRQRIDRPAS